MTKLVQLSIVKQERRLSVEEAWEAFVEADAKAKQTLLLEDGLRARRAYREFLELFDPRAA